MLIIIPAEEKHLPAILDIHNHNVRHSMALWTERESTLAERQTWLAERRASGFPVIVAEKPGMLLGYASYGTFRARSGYDLTVEHTIYVAHTARRQGVASALLTELIALARSDGRTNMIGGVEASNTASIALHEAFGFEQQGLLRGVGYKQGRILDLAFMVKAL